MTQYTACNTNTVSAVRTNTLNKYCTTLSVYKLLFVSHSMHIRIRKYCVTFSEKQEDYDVIFGQFPQEQLSLVIDHVIFLTNNKLWTVHV